MNSNQVSRPFTSTQAVTELLMMVKDLWKQSSPELGFSDDFFARHASTLRQFPSKTPIIGLWWGFERSAPEERNAVWALNYILLLTERNSSVAEQRPAKIDV